MIKFVILSGGHVFGMVGHLDNDVNNDFDKYITRNGFNDAESALEAARAIGIEDGEIIAIKLKDKVERCA